MGKLTGVLADAVNWAGVNEDDFQAALDACNNEQERAAYITDTLNGLYSDAAGVYRDVNESIIDARYANSEYTDSLAAMGEKMEPVSAAVQGGLAKIIDKAVELSGSVDLVEFADKVSDAFGYVAENILPKVVDGIGWIIDNKDVIIAIGSAIAGVSAVLAVLNGVLAIQSAIMAANPTTWIVMGIIVAIGLLIAAIVLLVQRWDDIKAAAINLWEALVDIWDNIVESVKEFIDVVKEKFKSGFNALVDYVMGPINKIKGFIDGLGDKISNFIGKLTGAKNTAESISIPAYAAGGFTQGLSIAGEAGTEAVISFNPAYREANLGYWAKAGRLLGATVDDAGFSLSGNAVGSTVIDMGGVSFSPKINITGNANKESVVKAIEAEYPEFLDLLDTWLREKGAFAYA